MRGRERDPIEALVRRVRFRLRFTQAVLVLYMLVSVLTIGLAIASWFEDDTPAEVIDPEITFAEPMKQTLARPAPRPTVEATLVSMLGPTDDVGATMAILGQFPQLENTPADAKIVLVEHTVEVSSNTQMSVAMVTSADLEDTLARLQEELSATGVHVVLRQSPQAFPVDNSPWPRNRNRWVELVGVTLADGLSWIGVSYRTKLETMFPEPLWQGELFAGETIDIGSSIQISVPSPGAPLPEDPFIDTGAAIPPQDDQDGQGRPDVASMVLAERVNHIRVPRFESGVATLEGRSSWFAGQNGTEIDASGTYIDPVGAIEFVTDDRRAQFITANPESSDFVFNVLVYAKRVALQPN